MIEFELLNNKGDYTLEAEDFETACVAAIILSQGRFGLRQINAPDNVTPLRMPSLVTYKPAKFFQENFGVDDFASYLQKASRSAKVADALDSIEKHGEVGRDARRIARLIRKNLLLGEWR